MKLLYSIGFAATVVSPSSAVHAIEEPRYRVVTRHEVFEVRQYEPFIVAEVTVPGPAEEAGNQGFRLLAAYISGKNQGERKIEMTAPVSQLATESGFAIQFAMPAGFTRNTLPEPLDSRIILKTVAAGRFAVIRYSGLWSDSNYQAHLDQLRADMSAAGLSGAGAPIYARYDAPFVPWFMRRNEIWIAVN